MNNTDDRQNIKLQNVNKLIEEGSKMKKQDMKELLQQEQEHNAKLQEDLDSTKSTSDMWYKSQQEKQRIIDEMHAMFDGIDGCSDRFVEKKDQYGGCSTVDISLSARFASYLQTLVK